MDKNDLQIKNIENNKDFYVSQIKFVVLIKSIFHLF